MGEDYATVPFPVHLLEIKSSIDVPLKCLLTLKHWSIAEPVIAAGKAATMLSAWLLSAAVTANWTMVFGTSMFNWHGVSFGLPQETVLYEVMLRGTTGEAWLGESCRAVAAHAAKLVAETRLASTPCS